MRAVPRASEFMVRRPPVLRPDTPVRDAARLLVRRALPGAAVVDEERRPVGVFSQQGLMVALVEALHHQHPAGTVADHLDELVPPVSEEAPLLTVVRIFVDVGEALSVLTVAREGRLVGVITRQEVGRAIAGALAANEELRAVANYLSASAGPEAPFDARRAPRRRSPRRHG